jgi:hypothetical protein
MSVDLLDKLAGTQAYRDHLPRPDRRSRTVSIEIIGMAGTQEGSESRGAFDGPPVKAGGLTRFAQAHEAAGFGRVPIGPPAGPGAPVRPA